MPTLSTPGRYFQPRLESLEMREVPVGDMVLHWNTIATDAGVTDMALGNPEQGGPTRVSRVLAMVQTAVYNAVAAFDANYANYRGDVLLAPKGANRDAAISQAAHDVLASVYSRQKTAFDARLKEILDQIPDGPGEEQGVAVGQLAAARMLAERTNDGSTAASRYEVTGGVGRWVPDPLHPTQTAVTPQWGQVKPFTMRQVNDFLAPPPPAIGSPEYAAAYEEVKRLGGDGITTPTQRTAEQTEIGLFWAYDGAPDLGTPPRFYNQILQQIATQQSNTVEQNARLFALANLAMADATIASWETKYMDDYWRPISGIRQGDTDNNPDTKGDANWTPLGAPATNRSGGPSANFTPAFPSYSSGHAAFGGALFETLRRFYGRDDIAFSLTSDEFNGVNRSSDGTVRPYVQRQYASFTKAELENDDSRIYLGIHWRFDCTEGALQGRKVAANAFNNFLTPMRSPNELFVTQLYRKFLNREPEARGLTHWSALLNQGVSPDVVSRGIAASPEANRVQVDKAYREILQREADGNGRENFGRLMDRGVTIDQVRAALIGSREYSLRLSSGDNANFVDSCVRQLLGRSATTNEMNQFTRRLANGESRESLAFAICRSLEYCGKLVDSMYEELLNRMPEDKGRVFWMNQLESGVNPSLVLAKIASSPEFRGQV